MRCVVSPWSLTVNWTGSPSSAVRLGTRPSTNIGGCRYESVAGFVSNTHNSVEHLVTPDSHLATHVYTPVSADSKFDIESLAARSSSDEVTLSSGLIFSSSLHRINHEVIYFWVEKEELGDALWTIVKIMREFYKYLKTAHYEHSFTKKRVGYKLDWVPTFQANLIVTPA